MIKVTDIFRGKIKYLNQDFIIMIETVPETLIILSNGQRHMVKETPENILKQIGDLKSKR